MSGETTSQVESHVKAVAGDCLVTAPINPSRILTSQVDNSHLVCSQCKLLVNGPVQRACERLVCAQCVIEMLHAEGPSSTCPSCGAPATSAHFRRCASMVANLLENLRVKCSRGCHFRSLSSSWRTTRMSVLFVCHRPPCLKLHLGKS